MEKAVLYSETTLYKTGRTAVKTAEKNGTGLQKQNPVPFRKKKNRQQKSFQKKENTDQIHGKNLLIKKRSAVMEEMEKSHRSQETAG